MRQHRGGFRRLLMELLTGEWPQSHRHFQRLSNLGPEELQVFRQAWRVAPVERREQVARALAQMAEGSTELNFRDVFLCCLDDEQESVRAAAISGLCDDESRSVLNRLMALAVQDPSSVVRGEAVLALGRFAFLAETNEHFAEYRDRLADILLAIHGDTSASLEARQGALEGASYFGGMAGVETAIARAYDGPEPGMRVCAVRSMGHHMAGRWRPIIERELASAEEGMRLTAARACGEIGDPELVHLLAPLLQDGVQEVVLATIWALGEIGGDRARRLLERSLQREERAIREAAEEALYTLRFYDDPMGWGS